MSLSPVREDRRRGYEDRRGAGGYDRPAYDKASYDKGTYDERRRDRRFDDSANERRIYVGNLPEDIRAQEVAESFKPYGSVVDVDVKYGRTRNGTAYAFVEFDTIDDAEAAVDKLDGLEMFGVKLRVEFTGQKKSRRPEYKKQPSGPPLRTEFRVIVTGLPRKCSWQDLKDFMRKAGNVGYAIIEDDGVGVVEYETEDERHRALDILQGATFRNSYGSAEVKVYTPEDAPNYSSRRREGFERRDYRREYSPKRRRYSEGPRRSPSDGRRRSPSAEHRRDRSPLELRHRPLSEEGRSSRSPRRPDSPRKPSPSMSEKSGRSHRRSSNDYATANPGGTEESGRMRAFESPDADRPYRRGSQDYESSNTKRHKSGY